MRSILITQFSVLAVLGGLLASCATEKVNHGSSSARDPSADGNLVLNCTSKEIPPYKLEIRDAGLGGDLDHSGQEVYTAIIKYNEKSPGTTASGFPSINLKSGMNWIPRGRPSSTNPLQLILV